LHQKNFIINHIPEHLQNKYRNIIQNFLDKLVLQDKRKIWSKYATLENIDFICGIAIVNNFPLHTWCDELDKSVYVADGLYCYTTYINHSCHPNVLVAAIPQKRLAIQINLDIKEGEELGWDYTEGLEDRSTKHKDYLFNNWGIICTCEQIK